VLAHIGTFTFASSGFFGPGLAVTHEMTTDRDMFCGFIGDCLFTRGADERLGSQLTEQLWTFVSTHAPLLDELAPQAVLVHADFNEPNIMLEQRAGHWAVTAVLDWEFAFAGTPLCDVGNMLRNEQRRPPAFAQAFIAGFGAAGGQLPQNWKRQAKLLDLLSLIDFLTRSTGGAPMVRDVTQLIVATMEQWPTT
jgi:fructokinase